MRSESKKYLWDALTAADQITSFVTGEDFDSYCRNPLLRSAVERQMEIIGEAMAQMARRDPESANAIQDVGRIIAFRNLLIHGYATVDNRVVWGVIESSLDSFRSALRKILEND
jgi:uncharacterized protein with HEPN domain